MPINSVEDDDDDRSISVCFDLEEKGVDDGSVPFLNSSLVYFFSILTLFDFFSLLFRRMIIYVGETDKKKRKK
jgi:hypothetical protein